jgi:hypothetical protein
MSGRPFEAGNKFGRGRPTGSRNKRSIYQEALESHGIEIIETCKLQALKKDATALRLCDLTTAISALDRAVARGRISASEGESVGRLIESHRRTLETETFEARVRALEKARSEEEAA